MMKAVFKVRNEVFVQEQNVSEAEEYDNYETSSTHLAATLDGTVVGTCRYRNTEKGVKLERFAILKEERGLGIGRDLVNRCIHENRNSVTIYLHAQIQVVDFYNKLGFEREGPLFEEAGIQHYKMVYTV